MIAPEPNERPGSPPNTGSRRRATDGSGVRNDFLLRRYSKIKNKSNKKRNNDTISQSLKKKNGMSGRSDTYVEPNANLSVLLDKQEEKKYKKEKDEHDGNTLNDIRLKMKKFVLTSFLGKRYMNILLGLSIFSCLQFIYQTYLDEDKEADKQILDFFGFMELILAALFGFDWCLWLFLADDRLEQLVSFFALVDFLTVIPIWLTYFIFSIPVKMSEVTTFSDCVNYMMYGAYTLRILRVLRVHKNIDFMEDEVQRFLAQMTLSVITLILFVSALVQYLEQETQNLPFHTWIYFLVVTMSTVGYGDIKPFSTLGRFGTMFFICFAIIFVPQQSNELIEKMNRVSYYARRRFKPQGNSQHILICGDLDSTDLREFFSELFHEDHEMSNLQAVIVQPNPPSDDLHRILRDPIFSLIIHFIQGSVLKDHDLSRAKAESAIAIFFMANKFSATPDDEDSKTILQQFSIKRYLGINKSMDPVHCLQLIRPENRKHLGIEGDDSRDKELVVCLNEIKMGIIAKSVMFPGTSTLIFNFLASFAEDPMEAEANAAENKKQHKKKVGKFESFRNLFRGRRGGSEGIDLTSFHDFDNNNVMLDEEYSTDDDDNDDGRLSDGHWMEEYQAGCDWEIYTSELSNLFEGALFINVASALYSKLGVVLFALQIREVNGRQRTRVVLNPANFKIPSKEDYFVEGFVIAKNKVQSDLSFDSADVGGENEMTLLKASIRKAMNTSSKHISSDGVVKKVPGVGVPLKADRFSSQRSRLSGTHKNKLVDKRFAKKKDLADWQLAMNEWHNNPSDKQNSEEVKIKLHDEELKRNFYVRVEGPRDYADCIIHTNILDEYPFMINHLIVIVKSLNTLYDFIRPLRAKYLRKLSHIVILYPKTIPFHIWRRISIFEGILHVRGSPLEEADLRRAGVFRAEQVIVLADPNAEKHEVNHDGTLDDADAIFTYHSVRRLNDKAQVLVEIVRDQNVCFLNKDSYGESEYKFTPQFASGLLFTSTILDSIVCQAFYNPQIIRVLSQLISGTDHVKDFGDEKNGERVQQNEKRSHGAKRHKGKKQSSKPSPKDKDSGKTANMFNIRGSALYQIPVPDKLETNTYGCCAEYLADRGVLPLGIYRGMFANMSVGARGNKMPYVFTNPSKDVELFSCDRIFVLSQSVLSNSTWSIQEVLTHFQSLSHFPQSYEEELHEMPRVMQLVNQVLKDKAMRKALDEKATVQASIENQFANFGKVIMKDFDFCLQEIEKLRHRDNGPPVESKPITQGRGAQVFRRMQSQEIKPPQDEKKLRSQSQTNDQKQDALDIDRVVSFCDDDGDDDKFN